MRGLPGSGKSTMAHKLAGDDGVVFSTDEYFIENGEYHFDSTKLKEAHLWNQDRAREAMEQGKPLIIVDNCNVRFWEAKKYVRVGYENGYDIQFQEPDTYWSRIPEACANKTTKRVPLAIIQRMHDDWDHEPTINKVLESYAPWEKHH